MGSVRSVGMSLKLLKWGDGGGDRQGSLEEGTSE